MGGLLTVAPLIVSLYSLLHLAGSSDDFAPISVSRTFQPNSNSSLCFSMSVIDDTIVEGDETFIVTLSSPDTPTDRLSTVIIRDDDGRYLYWSTA